MRGSRRGRASRRRESQSCSRTSDSRRSTTWQKKGMGKIIRTTRPAPSHCQSQKPKCRCSSLDTASPRASTAWLAIFPQSSPNLPSALWTTSSLPRWRAAQVSPQLTSQLQHRAAPSSQCAMGASFRVLRLQRRPSTSVRSRRLSAQSVKSGQRWSGGAPNQVRFGWCGSVSELVKLTPH